MGRLPPMSRRKLRTKKSSREFQGAVAGSSVSCSDAKNGAHGIAKPRLIIRPMSQRWGSFTAKGNLVPNTELAQASPHLIDYVIAHELAHALHPDHGANWRW